MSNEFGGRTRALMIGLCLVIAVAACGGTGDSFLTVINGGTGVDTTGPTVVATNPAAGASDVPTNASIIVTFSEIVDSASVTNGRFRVTPGVTGTIVVNGSTATLRPDPGLPASTLITVSIDGVRDRSGNVMATTYSTSFATGL